MTTYQLDKIVDVSHNLHNDMPVYPGDTPTSLVPTAIISKDGMNLSRVIMSSHAGTHIDAPSHFVLNGITIDQIPPGRFIGEAIVIDVSSTHIGDAVKVDEFTKRTSGDRHPKIKADDIVIFYTGSSELWGNPTVEKKYTYLSESLAEELVQRRVRAVGIDSFSVDGFDSTTFPVHKTILRNNLFIIESISSSLREFLGRRILLICPPLKLASLDGAPCRCLAVPIAE